MAIASDLISELPDNLLCVILSYLPIKDAVRSSVLATRWRYLYHQLPKLILSPDLLMGSVIPNPPAIAQVENIISNILLLHSSHLETLDLYATDDWNFTSRNICKWVHCVASKNIKNLYLRHFSASDPYPDKPEPDPNHPREILPPSLFLCNRLCRLTLFDCIVSEIPTGFGGFKNLTRCCFGNVEFRDDTLALFLSQCPFLRVLQLESCVVPENITTISGPYIEVLFLRTTNSVETLTVNCPKLIRFDIFINTNDLRVNGILFKELSSDITELFMNTDGTLNDMVMVATNNLWAEKCAKITETFKFLKYLNIDNHTTEEKMDIPTTKLLQGLPNLKSLYIDGGIRLVRIFVFVLYVHVSSKKEIKTFCICIICSCFK